LDLLSTIQIETVNNGGVELKQLREVFGHNEGCNFLRKMKALIDAGFVDVDKTDPKRPIFRATDQSVTGIRM
jgi:hypothetical protein